MTPKTTSYPPSDEEIADFIGQSELNIRRTYATKPHKRNFYYCLQVGTALNRHNVDDEEFYETMLIVKEVLKNKKFRRKIILEVTKDV